MAARRRGRRRAAVGAGAIALLGAAAVLVAVQPAGEQPAPMPGTPPPGISAPTAVCHRIRDVLPDPACTPGAVLPGVTRAQVCTPGWAAAHRKVTAAVRREVLARYGGAPAGPYELDHLVSLELGGTNDPANLWPQLGPIPNPKDAVENRLHRLVCAGRLDLGEAQHRIAADWTTAAD